MVLCLLECLDGECKQKDDVGLLVIVLPVRIIIAKGFLIVGYWEVCLGCWVSWNRLERGE